VSRKSREKGGVIFSLITLNASKAIILIRSREELKDYLLIATSWTLIKLAYITNKRQLYI